MKESKAILRSSGKSATIGDYIMWLMQRDSLKIIYYVIILLKYLQHGVCSVSEPAL